MGGRVVQSATVCCVIWGGLLFASVAEKVRGWLKKKEDRPMGNDEQTCSCGIGGKAGSLRQCSYPEIDERRTICVSFFMFSLSKKPLQLSTRGEKEKRRLARQCPVSPLSFPIFSLEARRSEVKVGGGGSGVRRGEVRVFTCPSRVGKDALI